MRWSSRSLGSIGVVGLALAMVGLMSACQPPSTDSGNVPLSGGDGGGGASGSPAIRGRLATGQPRTAPLMGRSADVTDLTQCTVVAVSNETGKVYRGSVNADGSFLIDIPDSEAGNTFIQTILGPDGKPLGPIVLPSSDGATGIAANGEMDLGTISLPADLGASAILAGTDGNVGADDIDADTRIRLDGNGVPVGVNSFGKGADSLLSGGSAGSGADRDKDGLVDLFDADDDGNGVVNDFEPGRAAWVILPGGDVRPSFFMNLKIGVEDAAVFYTGTDEAKNAALAARTVITFEVVPEPTATRTIASVRMLEIPAPSYLPTATVLAPGPGPAPLWSASGYAFNLEGDGRYDAFVTPQAVMSCGDSFTVEVAYTDGTSEQFTRMIAYVFKSIPAFVQYGTAGSLKTYDPNGASETGRGDDPMLFDGSQDLTLVFRPPTDDTGAPMTRLDYQFGLFFYRADGSQINGIDAAATWPTPVPGLSMGTSYNVSASSLTLAGDGTYTVTLPKEIFPDSVVLTGTGEVVPVASYKIDIAAQCPSGNAAIMAKFAKQ